MKIAPNIMVLVPNITEQNTEYNAFEPKIMKYAPHIMKKALNRKAKAPHIKTGAP